MKIDCESCVMFQTSNCEDCLVTALLHPGNAVDIDEELDEPLQALAGADLIPVLRFRPRQDPGAEPPPVSETG